MSRFVEAVVALRRLSRHAAKSVWELAAAIGVQANEDARNPHIPASAALKPASNQQNFGAANFPKWFAAILCGGVCDGSRFVEWMSRRRRFGATKAREKASAARAGDFDFASGGCADGAFVDAAARQARATLSPNFCAGAEVLLSPAASAYSGGADGSSARQADRALRTHANSSTHRHYSAAAATNRGRRSAQRSRSQH